MQLIMKHLLTPLLVLLITGANGQGIGKTSSGKAFNELSIADKMKVMKQTLPSVLKQHADSICAAQNIIIKDDKGLPVDIAKAIAANKILIENGVVFYLPNGTPSPMSKKENASIISKN